MQPLSMNLELGGKNVLVTGGSSGMGLAGAKRFLEEGARVAIIGRDRAKLGSALAELRAVAKDRVTAEAGDVSNPAEVARLHESVMSGLGGVDILFNNAGTGSE